MSALTVAGATRTVSGLVAQILTVSPALRRGEIAGVVLMLVRELTKCRERIDTLERNLR